MNISSVEGAASITAWRAAATLGASGSTAHTILPKPVALSTVSSDWAKAGERSRAPTT